MHQNRESLKRRKLFPSSNTDEDEEISLHDESDYDEDVEDSDAGNAIDKDESDKQ